MLQRRRKILVTLLSIFSLLFLMLILIFIVLFSMSKNLWYIAPIIITSIYLIQLCFGIWIFFSKRIMEVKASWNLVLLIPIFGIFIFLMFGTIPFKLMTIDETKQSKKMLFSKQDYTFTKKFINEHKDEKISAIYNIQGNPIYENNNIVFLDNYDLLKQSLEIIQKAKEFINVQYYIIAESLYLKTIVNSLIKKKREGIQVKFMYDYVGSHSRFSKKMIKKMKDEGIEVAVFNPPMLTKFMSMINFRSHRKSIIVDNKYCVTGGSNIGDEYINIRKKYCNWNDTNFYLEGEIVNSLNLTFIYDWFYNSTNRNQIKKIYEELDKLKIHKSNEKVKIITVDSEPYSEYKMMTNLILSSIANAKEKICIVTPYFALNNSIIDILNYKALLGLDVILVIPRRPDNKPFIIEANMSMFPKLSEKINVYLYDGFIHSKTMIIDNDIFVGTNNMDYRSLIINFETMFIIKDKNIYHKFSNYLNDIISCSIKPNFKEIYNSQPWYKKIKMKFINVIYPLI